MSGSPALRHISIRVPWHDAGWDGTVCKDPKLNGACLKLKRIAADRDDEAEHGVRGQSLAVLPQEQWPCCVTERMAFMAPFEYTRRAGHPYVQSSPDTHGHFLPTPIRHPPYSAPALPFSWVLRENMTKLGEEYQLNVQAEREPQEGFLKDTTWVQDKDNQTALLDCFFGQLKPEQSLCFFYAKLVPQLEDAGTGRRVLIGVGRVKHVGDSHEYLYNIKDLKGKLRSVLWERMVQHSIRPDFADGFLLPYHAAIERAKVDPDFNPVDIAALSPADRLLEFSHASQHVTHDGALSSLLACATALQNAGRTHLDGPWEQCLKWIDSRLGELWRMRGPCPGLGAALVAFGVELGTFVAREIAGKLGENEDPWPLADKVICEPKKYLSGESARQITKPLTDKWQKLKKDHPERLALLRLLSRFDLNPDQATNLYVEEERENAGIQCQDRDLLANPYLVYEATRVTAEPVSIWTVDRGVFPDQAVREKHPLAAPSALEGGTDPRRVRAMTVAVLEEAAGAGNTLLPEKQLILRMRELPIQPACLVDRDMMEVAGSRLPPAVQLAQLADKSRAYQLGRLVDMGEVIRSAVNARTGVKVKRLRVEADWRKLLDAHLGNGSGEPDEMEERARTEKTAALKELAESRLSVLIGPAGTGKTTLLSILCDHPAIAEGGLLLLAPTGKARVRMEQAAKNSKLKGFTIAQFLQPDRYDIDTGRYRLSDTKAEAGARTVMVDEASMLTEEMLGALLQALKGVDRLILIGDPRQLPPIGAGRPFVDIIKQLQPPSIEAIFPRVATGYAELTVRRRQAGRVREDLQLAEWFSGATLGPGDDDVFDLVVKKGASDHVRFVRWDTPEEAREKLTQVLIEELKLSGADDIEGFDKTLGGAPWNDLRFFNLGCAQKAEGWQILSPVRGLTHGVAEINRLIHRTFRAHAVEAASKLRNRKIPRPMGAEEIVYGDKVINVRNHSRKKVWGPRGEARRYIANGEIGMAVGFFHKQGLPDMRWKLEVEFSSQPSFKYDFTSRDFGEESEPTLELAYALTVHKAQGSEFGLVFFVLPNPCRLLSRELLYTALTRQRERVVILHQGERSDLKKYASDSRSETARRLTNLFVPPAPIQLDNGFFEDRLIHRTRRGDMVRSKSEVIIADCLTSLGVDYLYERELTLDGATKFPDFTIESAETGNVFYWEHCGMLHLPEYRHRWEAKLRWYREHAILPHEEGGGDRGTLIVTRETDKGAISSQEIEGIIKSVIKP